MIVCKLQPYAASSGRSSPIFKLAVKQAESFLSRKSEIQGYELKMNNHVAEENLVRLSMIKSILITKGKDVSTIIPQQSQFENLSNGANWDTKYLSHGWHRYIGRFPPQIVRSLLNLCKIMPKENILDPFVGSGTTLVEAKLLGINSIGYELSPLSALIAKVKTRLELDPVSVDEQITSLFKDCYEMGVGSSRKIKSSDFKSFPDFSNRDRWFNPLILSDVLTVIKRIKEIRNRHIQEFCVIGLSHLLRHYANVDGQVVRPEYKEKNWDNYDILVSYKRHLYRMINDLKKIHSLMIPTTTARVYSEDARNLSRIDDKSIDFIITSPPYGVRAISYLETHFLSYHLFQSFLKYSFSETKVKVIGTEKIDENLPEVSELTSSSAQLFVKKLLYNKNIKLRKRGLQYTKYFHDMQSSIEEMERVLKNNKNACMIIGDKYTCEMKIPLVKIMKEMFSAFKLELVHKIDTKLVCNFSKSIVPWNDRIIDSDSILIFRK